MSIQAAKETFFKSGHYAVVGASKDRTKYGNKVLRWYKEHGLDTVAVHPKETSVEEMTTLANVSDLREPKKTSVSVITPPKVTLSVIKTALLDLDVAGVWLQPGAEDDEVKKWVQEQDEATKNKVILGGSCILVEGEGLAKAAGKL
ncbi:NAD-P-binding protein [Acaromyces ingoldii]|uniref:NAD-P-binding protein n=1 Tax=Acaromyces ingoldii TaxID=215250 RepID=A0A316YMV7_9BASI|nr:NAD-P-binding protein [Acaromyces ingoldii]PWN90144.1 NAD-P-binding protein [Acaromyces ingoldii]